MVPADRTLLIRDSVGSGLGRRRNRSTMSREERRDALVNRMRAELGYKSVKPWPILERQNGGAIMYYMIHATDHPDAPAQMSRAYHHAVSPLEPLEQAKIHGTSRSCCCARAAAVIFSLVIGCVSLSYSDCLF